MAYEIDAAEIAEENVLYELPITLQMSRKKIASYVVVCVLVAALCQYFYLNDAGSGWLIGMLVSAALVVLGLLQFKNPTTLIIDENGFALRTWRKCEPKWVHWGDVEGFGVMQINHNRYVRYQMTKASGRRRPLGGVVLPDNFGLPVEVLAEMLEACRSHFAGTTPWTGQ